MKDIYKKTSFKKVAVGGVRCSCCNDFHGQKKKLRRWTRRKVKGTGK